MNLMLQHGIVCRELLDFRFQTTIFLRMQGDFFVIDLKTPLNLLFYFLVCVLITLYPLQRHLGCL